MNKSQQNLWHQILMIGRDIDIIIGEQFPDWDEANRKVLGRTGKLKKLLEDNSFDKTEIVTDLVKIQTQVDSIRKRAQEQQAKIKEHLLGQRQINKYLSNTR